MRVAISLLTLVPGVSGGSETYARELVRALGRVGTLEYRVFLPSLAADVEGLPGEVVREYRASRSSPGRLLAMGAAFLGGRRLRRRFAGLDVLHYPLTVTVPRPSAPAVVTLHDLQHRDLPQLHRPAVRAFRRIAYERAARRAAAVIVPSEHARARAVELLGLDPERVRVIPHGLDHAVFSPGQGERRPFLLYPALPWPHKNHARLFQAFQVLRARHPGLELVLTGHPGPAPDGVRALGRVPRQRLVELYRSAACLVFPSLYEGFGQPSLEAMACGCPVACSNAAALPEVCGQAARLFDPTSIEDMVQAVEEILADPAPWIARGLHHARTYTWENTARCHEQAYVDAAS